MARYEYSSLRQGLVGAWCPSLGATGLSLIDRSGLNNHGTLTNMAGQDNWQASGSGLALRFDGVNDFVATAYAGQLGNFTASAWFCATGNGAGNYERIINKKYDTGFVICRRSNFANTWAAYILDPTAAAPIIITLTDGVWHHICFVRSGTTGTLYGDGGTVSASATVPSTLLDATAVTIGRSTPAEFLNQFLGQLDDIRLYSRALTLAEIRLLASRRGIGLSPLPDRAAGLPRRFSVNVGGTWRSADSYVNVGGVWRLGQPSVNVGGVWK